MTASRKRKRLAEPANRQSSPTNMDELPKHLPTTGEVSVEEFKLLLDLLKREPRRLDWFRGAKLNPLTEEKLKTPPADPI